MKTILEVVENDGAKIMRDIQIQTDKVVMASQPDQVVVDKKRKEAVIDIAVQNDSSIRRNEHESSQVKFY